MCVCIWVCACMCVCSSSRAFVCARAYLCVYSSKRASFFLLFPTFSSFIHWTASLPPPSIYCCFFPHLVLLSLLFCVSHHVCLKTTSSSLPPVLNPLFMFPSELNWMKLQILWWIYRIRKRRLLFGLDQNLNSEPELNLSDVRKSSWAFVWRLFSLRLDTRRTRFFVFACSALLSTLNSSTSALSFAPRLFWSIQMKM